MKRLILVGGPMGIGKSTVGHILNELLTDSIYIEGDDGWIGIPFNLTEENKIKVINNITNSINDAFKSYNTVILGWVMDKQETIDKLLSLIKCNDLTVKSFSLISSLKVLTKRLNTDIKKGKRKIDVIDDSLRRLRIFDEVNSIKIDTSKLNPLEVANKIISNL